MSREIPAPKHSVVEEIARKIRLSIAIVAFVIVTLFAVIVRYLFEPLAQYLSFVPRVSIEMILSITLALSVVGMYYSVVIARQVLRIIRDYATRLERILAITRDLREEVYGDILLEKIMDAALAITSSEAGSVLLRDGESLVFKIVRGENEKTLIGRQVDAGAGIIGYVAQSGTTLRIADTSKDDRFNPSIDEMTGFRTKSILCVPLRTTAGVIGVIELLNKRGGHPYRERDEEIITYLAEQAAISIIKTQFLEDQKNYEIHLTDILLEAIDYHLPEKSGHSRRVARYANIIAKGLHMTEEERKRLYRASLLHDVGFLKISADNAFKREEYSLHPLIGFDMIKPINFYADIAPLILHHHERIDGHGYPSKLAGEDIPLEARIIAIAEAFDAMVSAVSYRIPVSFTEAVEELRRRAGTQFDQELVEIFVTNISPEHIKP